MISHPDVDSVAPAERLARYLFRKNSVRPDGTVKPDEFIPYRHTTLSVTRHKELLETELWIIGSDVAAQRQVSLYGRGDTLTQTFLDEKLMVRADPLKENPNHANVEGWPTDKQTQKSIALEIVRSVQFVPKPSN